jgi:hypothetical protein
MKRLAKWLSICVLSLAVGSTGGWGCRAPETQAQLETAAPPAEPEMPPEIAAVASTVLGRSAEVVAFGDLAHNGRQQVLVANTVAANKAESGVRFTRAAVLERAGAKWSEVLRCDEYLKNPNGFLGGSPLEPVTSWRLELSKQSGNQERELRFTPLRDSGKASMPAVSVRWNPAANRYQSVDPQTGQFLAEVSVLQTPVSPLR